MVLDIKRRERLSPFRRLIEISYVVVIAALTTFATRDPNAFRQRVWVAALLLTLPALLAVLPVLYVTAAAAWNVTGADNGGLRWPVTATYVLMLTLAALLNVALWRIVTNTRRRRRLNSSSP